MSAAGREDLRASGEDLRTLGTRVAHLSEEVSHMAQSYRTLYEKLRMCQRPLEAVGNGGKAGHAPPAGVPPPPADPASDPTDTSTELAAVRRMLRALLERQGELGLRLKSLAGHPLFFAGGEEPRRIRARLVALGERCQNLRLSSDSLARGSPRSLSGLLDDLCELNSEASEDLHRFGYGLRTRAEGILAGRKEDLRFLQGEAWRRIG